MSKVIRLYEELYGGDIELRMDGLHALGRQSIKINHDLGLKKKSAIEIDVTDCAVVYKDWQNKIVCYGDGCFKSVGKRGKTIPGKKFLWFTTEKERVVTQKLYNIFLYTFEERVRYVSIYHHGIRIRCGWEVEATDFGRKATETESGMKVVDQ